MQQKWKTGPAMIAAPMHPKGRISQDIVIPPADLLENSAKATESTRFLREEYATQEAWLYECVEAFKLAGEF